LQLEFRYLSFLTGNTEYWEKAERVCGVTLSPATAYFVGCLGYGSYKSGTGASRIGFYIYDVSRLTSIIRHILLYFQRGRWKFCHIGYPPRIPRGLILRISLVSLLSFLYSCDAEPGLAENNTFRQYVFSMRLCFICLLIVHVRTGQRMSIVKYET